MRQGFTLVELLIWMAVFGLLSVVSVANFRAGARNDTVRQAAAQAAGELRLAQTLTLSGAVRVGAGFPAGGWGVRFDPGEPGRAVLFADADADFNYDAGEESETVFFPAKAAFLLADPLSVVFSPPEGAVYFNGATAPDSKAIVFQTAGAGLTKTVTVYRVSGQVRVE